MYLLSRLMAGLKANFDMERKIHNVIIIVKERIENQ